MEKFWYWFKPIMFVVLIFLVIMLANDPDFMFYVVGGGLLIWFIVGWFSKRR